MLKNSLYKTANLIAGKLSSTINYDFPDDLIDLNKERTKIELIVRGVAGFKEGNILKIFSELTFNRYLNILSSPFLVISKECCAVCLESDKLISQGFYDRDANCWKLSNQEKIKWTIVPHSTLFMAQEVCTSRYLTLLGAWTYIRNVSPYEATRIPGYQTLQNLYSIIDRIGSILDDVEFGKFTKVYEDIVLSSIFKFQRDFLDLNQPFIELIKKETQQFSKIPLEIQELYHLLNTLSISQLNELAGIYRMFGFPWVDTKKSIKKVKQATQNNKRILEWRNPE